MICSFCSLLCDELDLSQIQCDLRSKSLVHLAALRSTSPVCDQKEIESNLLVAAEKLSKANQVLITGRIASVQTARAAVALAERLNATIDCADEGHVFKNILAIQRTGLNSVSIAEARDLTDLFIVIGDDSLLDDCPRMPKALQAESDSAASPKMVLLLGDFNRSSQSHWEEAGFDVWYIPCALSKVPSALAQWSSHASRSASATDKSDSSIATRPLKTLQDAKYITVLWSATNLKFSQADLWIERLLQWIADCNEDRRCAGLLWSSLDGTFQQTCTWLTGFPGRIRFTENVPHYDPNANTYQRWIEDAVKSGSQKAIILIDERVSQRPFELNFNKLDPNISLIQLTPDSRTFPVAVAGIESTADMFRADQAIMAHVKKTESSAEGSSQQEPRFRPAAYWLERLCR